MNKQESFLLKNKWCYLSIQNNITVINPTTNRKIGLKTWKCISKSQTGPIMLRNSTCDISNQLSELKKTMYENRFILKSAASSSLAQIMSTSPKKSPMSLPEQMDFLTVKHAGRLDGITNSHTMLSFFRSIKNLPPDLKNISANKSVSTQLNCLSIPKMDSTSNIDRQKNDIDCAKQNLESANESTCVELDDCLSGRSTPKIDSHILIDASFAEAVTQKMEHFQQGSLRNNSHRAHKRKKLCFSKQVVKITANVHGHKDTVHYIQAKQGEVCKLSSVSTQAINYNKSIAD